jgi:hypothetical protein
LHTQLVSQIVNQFFPNHYFPIAIETNLFGLETRKRGGEFHSCLLFRYTDVEYIITDVGG